jgi:segregation and condensation protein A
VKGYTVRLDRVFQGPMDLLLHLVREQEVEIHEVEISRVIRGYVGYLDLLRELDIELAGEFLVMAATLMSIKSRSLLPREEVDLEDELDPRDELIQRLLEYRRFKEAAQGLHWSQHEREQLHSRGAFPELDLDRPEPTLDLGELTAWDLLGVFSRLMRETLANRPHHIQGDPRPLRYYVGELARRVKSAGRVSLSALLIEIDATPTRETLVGSFCALLELVKLGVVSAAQSEHRGEIDILFQPDVEGDLEHLLDGTRFDDELDERRPSGLEEGGGEPLAVETDEEDFDEELEEGPLRGLD